MSLTKLIQGPFRYKLWRPRHIALLAGDISGSSVNEPGNHDAHAQAAIDWLCRAQDRRMGETDAGGVSAGWSFEDGWLPSYPETSGYIVETFIAASEVLDRPELRTRANRILDWELSIQNPDGSFPGHFGEPGSQPVIFNTGQIIHGMIAGYAELGRTECLEAAVRAGHWMMGSQDKDGCWRRNVHNGVPHTYNTRAAWGLLHAAMLADERELVQSAVRNFEWALTQQTESGWYQTTAFVPDRAPFTHTIAYAIRGLLEGGLLLQDDRFIASATKAAEGLARAQGEDGWLAGTYSDQWISRSSYCCLTGVAQTTLVWQRLRQALARTDFRDNIDRALRYLKSRQRITQTGTPEDGAIAGSFPIWGDYSRFEFPNWATKFYADALIQDMADVAIPEPRTRFG